MADSYIYIKDVKRRIDLSPALGDNTFDIAYRKMDGSHGEKTKCRLRSGKIVEKSDFASIKHENRRAGKLKLEYHSANGHWQKSEIWLCL